jgi:hypothetical protein
MKYTYSVPDQLWERSMHAWAIYLIVQASTKVFRFDLIWFDSYTRAGIEAYGELSLST